MARMWQGIEGHDDVAEYFRSVVAAGRLASTFLFVGPEGVGKRSFALQLSKALLCANQVPNVLAACGQCAPCRLVDAGNHPDLEYIRRHEERQFLTLDLFIGDKDHRNREGLCHRIALKPSLGRRKIAIIDDADHFNQESANCLLKTLEEPPPGSLMILLGTSPSKQLPTIRSRSQIVRFAPLPTATVARLLREMQVVEDEDAAAELAALGQGSLHRATLRAEPELRRFRQRTLEWLGSAERDAVAFAAEVDEFVGEAGREAKHRRARLRQVILTATEFYRGCVRQAAGAAVSRDEKLQQAMQRRLATAGDSQQPLDADLQRLDRCLAALDELDRNANQATLIACWLDDLAG